MEKVLLDGNDKTRRINELTEKSITLINYMIKNAPNLDFKKAIFDYEETQVMLGDLLLGEKV
jgi:hypothetical protein